MDEITLRWHPFHRTVHDIKARNANTDSEELRSLIDEALHAVRAERRAQKQATQSGLSQNHAN